jgi:hypothetical protein
MAPVSRKTWRSWMVEKQNVAFTENYQIIAIQRKSCWLAEVNSLSGRRSDSFQNRFYGCICIMAKPGLSFYILFIIFDGEIRDGKENVGF